ncbi:MAG TPA: sigma-70 family RNA polymerase sigma factor [Chloroflexi bacterium]|nr:sigma-70 family RNA polymerase sigma factor [Chloroflexota bacterium]
MCRCGVSTDQELVARVLDGDRNAFAQLVETYQRPVYNLTYRMLGDPREAEDAAQEAFLRAYKHLERYDPSRSFKTWLLSIASNYCIDRLRKRRLTWLSIDEPLPPHPSLTSDAPDPETSLIDSERNRAVQELLESLAPDYRAAIVLRYWYDMSYAEIAEMLETTESAIKSRLFRARQMLAQRVRAGDASELFMAMESA